jgi:photosystem II stability/assembly factor-like uncharacterized protein
VNLSIPVGGNDDGHYSGERLQVDPNVTSTLYFGSQANGLWKSVNSGQTWSQITGLTATNLAFVCIDPTSGHAGSASQRLIVGTVTTASNLLMTTDGGTTWSVIAGQPSSYYPMRFALASNLFYVTYSSTDGQNPNGATSGTVNKYNLTTGQWANISPTTGSFGFGGICVDRENTNKLVCGTVDRYSQGEEIYRSSNGGASWTGILLEGTINGAEAPYVETNFVHNWPTYVEINPFNSNEAWFNTGYGLFVTEDLTDADAGKKVTWTFMDKGLEETVVLALASPPTGPWVYSALADVGGFRYDSLDTSPAAGDYGPFFPTGSSIDFAELAPNIMVWTHTQNYYIGDSGTLGSYSRNGGVTWTRFTTEPAGTQDSGVAAIAADGSRIVWTPAGEGPYYSASTNAGTFYSTNFGTNWTASTGIPGDLNPVADRVNPLKFYAYDAIHGIVYVSTNGGVSFKAGATGLLTLPNYDLGSASIKAVFGREGDLWLTVGTGTYPETGGFYHSTDSGSTFHAITGVTESHNVSFGKAATGQSYPAVFLVGTVNGVYGFFESDNEGVTWTRINDDQHQYGIIYSLAGDPKFYGRVYVGTVYADPVNPVAPAIGNVTWTGTNLSVPFQSESGFDYVAQEATNLGAATVWSGIVTNAGTGGTVNLSVPYNSSSPQGWFRVKEQSPQ